MFRFTRSGRRHGAAHDRNQARMEGRSRSSHPHRRLAIAVGVATVLVATLASAAPASATEWMYCSDARSQVHVGLLLGLTDTLSVVAATLEAPKTAYTTNSVYAEGQTFTIRYVKGMLTDAKIGVDFITDPGDKLVGELRLRKGHRGEMTVYRGKLKLTGKGAWTVSCDAE